MPSKATRKRGGSGRRSTPSPAPRNAAMALLQSLLGGNSQLLVRIDGQPLELAQAIALAEQRGKAGQAREAGRVFDQLLAQAAEWHREKRLDDAEAVYRQVFEAQPGYIDALHLLGVIYSQRGDHQTAERLIRQALAENPSADTYHNNLGKALQGLGRLEEAATSYRRALELNPEHAMACNNLGRVFLELGRRPEAIASFRRAVELRPDYAEARANLERASR